MATTRPNHRSSCTGESTAEAVSPAKTILNVSHKPSFLHAKHEKTLTSTKELLLAAAIVEHEVCISLTKWVVL